jgi:hypothetical protein
MSLHSEEEEERAKLVEDFRLTPFMIECRKETRLCYAGERSEWKIRGNMWQTIDLEMLREAMDELNVYGGENGKRTKTSLYRNTILDVLLENGGHLTVFNDGGFNLSGCNERKEAREILSIFFSLVCTVDIRLNKKTFIDHLRLLRNLKFED